MSATKTSSVELLDEMLDAVMERRCPICSGPLSSSPEIGCVVVSGGMSCRTMNRMIDSDPRQVEYSRRERVLKALKLLLSSQH